MKSRIVNKKTIYTYDVSLVQESFHILLQIEVKQEKQVGVSATNAAEALLGC